MNLTDSDWKEFIIGEVFNVTNSKAYHKTDLSPAFDKEIPYVVRTMFNNGLDSFVEEKEDFIKNPKNSIVFGAESALFFYEPFEFITGNKMYYISHERFNKYVCLFLVAILNNAISNSKFDYYHGLTGSRLKNIRVLLPVDANENINFRFMEKYMKIKEEKYLSDCIENYYFLKNRHVPIPNFKEKKWDSFILSDVFDINSTKNGIDKNKIKDIDTIGDIPYITRSEKNNGINLFIIEQEYEINHKNVISIGLDTQTVFYQPFDFYTGQNIQILSNPNLNKYNSLFIVSLLKRTLNKFNWGGNGATLTRLNMSRLILPVDDDGTPDYEYMEQYMINSELFFLKKYLDYLE